MAKDKEYGDDEYLEEFWKEGMEHLEKEHKEEMTKFKNELKVGKVKVKFGDFDEVNAMVVTLPLFFEAQPNQPNYMDGDIFNEVESIVQMEGAKEIEMAREVSKEGSVQPCTVGPKVEEKLPIKVCYKMPTKKISSHHKQGPKDDALKIQEVELAPTEMNDSNAEVQDPLLKINFGTKDYQRQIYISGLMKLELGGKMEKLLRELRIALLGITPRCLD
ncbi:hypothetical protein L3X38_036883 [Prunus dulcis]|uniref:Uncharacterized protein n=1 Tax=Prunus dulcis TaxID=3755 RepID=A0AAD4V455_PRUDU|nr:hypothetical protein L3X38_036883 [Prunus dulcis]